MWKEDELNSRIFPNGGKTVDVDGPNPRAALWFWIKTLLHIRCTNRRLCANSSSAEQKAASVNNELRSVYQILRRLDLDELIPDGKHSDLSDHDARMALFRVGAALEQMEGEELARIFSETPTKAPESKRPPPNVAKLVTALRKRGARTQASLVEYMSVRESAAIEEVAEHVHDNRETSDGAIRQNVKRTNESLAELESTIHFRVRAAYLFKEEYGE